MSWQVFISYESSDRPVAERVAERLEARGIVCWIAPRDARPGDEWMARITEAIHTCRVLVLVFSGRTNCSKHVIRELALAIDCELCLLVYRTENQRPEGSYEYALATTHRYDAFEPLAENHLGALVDAVAYWLSCKGTQDRVRDRRQEGRDDRSFDDLKSDPEHYPLLIRLAELMLDQRRVVLCTDELSAADLRIIDSLRAVGFVRNQPSPVHPQARFVAVANPADGERVLVQWVSLNVVAGVERLLHDAEGFPPLADGLGYFAADGQDVEAQRLLDEVVTLKQPIVLRVVCRAAQLMADQPAKLSWWTARIVERGSYVAARGLAAAGQSLQTFDQCQQAEALLAAAAAWTDRNRGAEQVLRFAAEIANERGRVLLRQQKYALSEAQLRVAFEAAQTLGDAILEGIIANNLASTLLETLPSAHDRTAEAVAILEANVERLRCANRLDQLAVAYGHLAAALSGQNPIAAESYYRKDIELCRELGDYLGLADGIDRLALFLAERGRCEEAQNLLNDELGLCQRRFFDRHREGRAFANLGYSFFLQWLSSQDRVRLTWARDSLLQGCALLRAEDVPALLAPALENLGRVQYFLGDCELGLATLKNARQQYQRFPSGQREARRLDDELGESSE